MALHESLVKFNVETPEDKLIEACQTGGYRDGLNPTENGVFLNYIMNLLNLQKQNKLLSAQNDFNTKMLQSNKYLVRATVALVIATLLLIFAK